MNLVKMLSGVKIPAAVMLAGVLGLALTGGVMAAMVAIPNGSDDGQIHGCVKKRANQGQLRIVSSDTECRPNETAIIIGGDGGTVGLTGPAGPEGPAGPGVEPTPASVVELKNLVTGATDGTTGAGAHLTGIMFDVALLDGEAPVDLTPGTTKIQLDYLSQSITSTTSNRFHTIPVSGADSDLILEAGEILQIELLDFETFLSPDLGAGTRFVIDVISEFGSVLSFEAETPDPFPGASVITLPVATP